ncbi:MULTISPECIES: PspC domain-containing protein [Streptomyces]|uniref:PspC domain-containing protein n=1 Tax=Streptomyces solicathayae TaxID=3081768 RepID=A0ABZ0LTS0_9ACTN|nr:PspC domain-containing protein [Streptomyces sp. HUAS YS2]WOX22596.1 PspC domain-containing protein [Streptomyces sp. HUAS YS2]
MTRSTTTEKAPPPAVDAPPLRRARRQKVVAGVCGGLARHFDLDPVIFRIAVGVLSAAGGVGLIFYGFAWLALPLEGEEENEARRLLTGRVDGASLTAVMTALVGSGLFLTMSGNGSTLSFAMMLSIAVCGAAIWSQRRRQAGTGEPDGRVRRDATAAQAVADAAPPETKAPPLADAPSWWRDPIVKDGSTGPVPVGYLWGPLDEDQEAAAEARTPWGGPAAVPRAARGARSIGGRVVLLALVAGGLGTGLSWEAQPLGTAVQIGLVCALGVLGLGMMLSSFLGRTGSGTVFVTLVASGLLAVSAALPSDIGTHWVRTTWQPATVAAVQPRYEMGTGVGTLDLSRLAIPAGTTVRTGAEGDAGRLKVIVPRNVTVHLVARTRFADLRMPGERSDDIRVRGDFTERRTLAPPAGVKPGGTLELRLDLGYGQVEVDRAAA